jgi:hypothetical protein
VSYLGATQRLLVSETPANYRDGSFPLPNIYGPGMLIPPETVVGWSPDGMGEMTNAEMVTSITSSIAAAAGGFFQADAAAKSAKYAAKYGGRAREAEAQARSASAANWAKLIPLAAAGIVAALVLGGGYRALRKRRS